MAAYRLGDATIGDFMDGYLHFPQLDDRGVYQRLSRQVIDIIKQRLRRGPDFVRIETDSELTFEQITAVVDSGDFRPLAIILSPKPVAGIEGNIGNDRFRVFCSDRGGNDALVLSMAVKISFRDVWDELFVPLIPAYAG